ncbi:MAG: hypothetical protein WAO45_00940 [Tissierellaceae bacterium]
MKLKLMGSTCIAGGFIVWDTIINSSPLISKIVMRSFYFSFLMPESQFRL